MAGVFGGVTLAFKYMPQVTLAFSTDDLDSSSVRIGMSIDRPGDGIVKTGPSAPRVKFVV